MTAYNSAFKELREEGYLIQKDGSNEKETRFIFYEKSKKPEAEDQQTIIENEKEKVEKIRQIREQIEADQGEF